MTAILCTVRDGHAYLGTDSRHTHGWGYDDDARKLIVRGAWAFAVSGLAAADSWLRHAAPEQDPGEALEAYVYRLGCAFSAWRGTPSGMSSEDNTARIFAISRGRAWTIDANPLHINPIANMAGGGDSTATVAALRVARDHHGEASAILRALVAVSQGTGGVGGPFFVVSCDASTDAIDTMQASANA